MKGPPSKVRKDPNPSLEKISGLLAYMPNPSSRGSKSTMIILIYTKRMHHLKTIQTISKPSTMYKETKSSTHGMNPLATHISKWTHTQSA
jgi:hypothetical protein